MNGKNWRTDVDARIDLELENKQLQKKVEELGGMMGFEDDCPPDIKNQFLKNIIRYEETGVLGESEDSGGTEREIRAAFPRGYSFPQLENMSPAQLKRKLRDILRILASKNIYIELLENVPDGVVYTYIVGNVLSARDTFGPNRAGIHFTGCTGWCEECIQLPYCKDGQNTMAG